MRSLRLQAGSMLDAFLQLCPHLPSETRSTSLRGSPSSVYFHDRLKSRIKLTDGFNHGLVICGLPNILYPAHETSLHVLALVQSGLAVKVVPLGVHNA